MVPGGSLIFIEGFQVLISPPSVVPNNHQARLLMNIRAKVLCRGGPSDNVSPHVKGMLPEMVRGGGHACSPLPFPALLIACSGKGLEFWEDPTTFFFVLFMRDPSSKYGSGMYFYVGSPHPPKQHCRSRRGNVLVLQNTSPLLTP